MILWRDCDDFGVDVWIFVDCVVILHFSCFPSSGSSGVACDRTFWFALGGGARWSSDGAFVAGGLWSALVLVFVAEVVSLGFKFVVDDVRCLVTGSDLCGAGRHFA